MLWIRSQEPTLEGSTCMCYLKARLQKRARDKRSSLFCPLISYNEKSVIRLAPVPGVTFTTFYFLRNFWKVQISYSVCPWQSSTAKWKVTPWLIGLISKLQRNWSVVNTVPGAYPKGKHLQVLLAKKFWKCMPRTKTPAYFGHSWAIMKKVSLDWPQFLVSHSQHLILFITYEWTQ